jgi:hypothetical protein
MTPSLTSRRLRSAAAGFCLITRTELRERLRVFAFSGSAGCVRGSLIVFRPSSRGESSRLSPIRQASRSRANEKSILRA